MTYSPTKFEVATSNGLGGDAFTRNVTDGRTHGRTDRRTDGRTDGRRTDFDTKLIYPFFLKKKAGIIIQWNCQGLKPNYNEVILLISEYYPSVFCFQETFLKPDDNISSKGFNIYNYIHTDCLRPSGGASIFVKPSFPQRKIGLQTELQATAISVTLDREIIEFIFV